MGPELSSCAQSKDGRLKLPAALKAAVSPTRLTNPRRDNSLSCGISGDDIYLVLNVFWRYNCYLVIRVPVVSIIYLYINVGNLSYHIEPCRTGSCSYLLRLL